MNRLFGGDTQLRAVDYRRVSSEDQATGGFSLSAQTDIIHRFIEQKGWTHAGSFEDPGRSGKSVHRPGFQAMLAAAERGEFDVVVVHKIDRFSRSLTDFLLVLRQLKACNVRFVSTSEDLDFTTPIGELILVVLAWLAQWYLENLRAEVTKGKKERARKGHWNGTLPFGYTTPARLRQRLSDLAESYRAGQLSDQDYSEQAGQMEQMLDRHPAALDTQAIPDPINAAAVRYVFEQYATGRFSTRAIAALLNDQGFRSSGQYGNNPFGRDSVRDILNNRFYLGQTRYKGEVFDGAHEALVEPALFEKTRAVKLQRTRSTGYVRQHNRTNEYPLAGVLCCTHCGGRWTGATRRGKRVYRDGNRSHGAMCSAAVYSGSADEMEAAVVNLFGQLNVPEAYIREVGKRAPKASTDDKLRKSLEQRAERLRRLFEMGDIDEDTYLKRRAAVMRALDNLPERVVFDVAHYYDTLELLKNLPALWERANEDQRQEWLNLLIKKLWVENGQIVAAQATPLLWELYTLNNAGDRTEGEMRSPVRRRPDSNW